MFQRAIQTIQKDNLLKGILKSSSYLFSGSAIAAGLSFLQTILVVRLLGMDGFGLASGVVITFASNVNNLLSFRMSDVVVRYLGQALAEGKSERGAALVKALGLAEATVSLLAYIVLLALAPWAAVVFGKDVATAPLFSFYGLVLLVNLVYETSSGVLRTTKRFNRLAQINLIQSILTAAAIVMAYGFNRGIGEILAAYLLGKTFAGFAVAVLASRQLDATLGPQWWRAPLGILADWRAIAKFALSTNLSGTVNLLVRDSSPVLLAALRPAGVALAEVGYFRLALSIINLVMLPIEPFIWPTYSEITRTIAQQQWQTTRRLLKRVSAIAAAWTLAAGGVVVVSGWWLIPLIKPTAGPAYPAVVILLVGYGFANIFNWNRPLLLALGRPGFPLLVAALVGLVELALTFWLTPMYGYLAHAALLSGFFVASISLIVWRGLSLLRNP